MPDRWLDVRVRKVLRPTTSIQVFFLGFPVSWKQMLRWFPNIQDVPTCFSCSLPDVNLNFSSTVSNTCICVQNHCQRDEARLQLNKYYYIIIINHNNRPQWSGVTRAPSSRVPCVRALSPPSQSNPCEATTSWPSYCLVTCVHSRGDQTCSVRFQELAPQLIAHGPDR